MDINKLKESVSFIKGRIKEEPTLGLILGSGLGDMANDVNDKVIIKYSEVPNLPESTVHGHAGQFVFGKYNNKSVVMMQGRFHYYEGNSMEDLILPVYIMKELGVKNIIVTNAAGGVNTDYVPGDLMIISDHINYCGVNPLIGRNYEEIGARFPDMSSAYNKELIALAESKAENLGIKVKKGVYFMASGPSYETPAEVRMIRILGGDAVGMSTVPEVVAANHCGIKVLGISCITNMAAGILDQPLNHEEVIETSSRVKKEFINLVGEIIKDIK